MRSLGIKLALGLLRALGHLPAGLLNRLGTGLGELMWRLHVRERGVVEINLAHCFPAMPAAERERLAHAALRDFGANAFEMLHTWFAAPDRVLAYCGGVDGAEVLDAARAAGRGVIVLGPHFGNWEWLGLYLGHHYHAANMYLPPRENPELAAAVLAARSRQGALLVPADAGGVRTVLKLLKAGELVGILPDQEPKHAGAEFAPFFGRPALTMTLVSNLLQRTGARAVFAAAIRQPGRGYRLVFREPPAGIYSADLATSLAALNRGVEALAMEAPAQYQWQYKRFKQRPADSPDIYAPLKKRKRRA